MKFYDIFNGDADGICALHQLLERLTSAAGIDTRDAVWNHPDLMPSSSDLDEPAGFIDRIIGGDVGSIDVDSLIAEIEK